MNTNNSPTNQQSFSCENCPMRKKAEQNPKSFLSRLWRWHTGWCPGWKAYQAHLAGEVNK